MHQRLSISRQGFYLGLLLVLGASVMSASSGPHHRIESVIGLTFGAGLAFAARLWHARLLRGRTTRRRPFAPPLDAFRPMPR